MDVFPLATELTEFGRLVVFIPVPSAFILAFTLSFDETLITLLVTGTKNTLPMWLWSSMRLGFKPDINALVALILFFSAALAYITMRLFRPKRAT